MTAWPLDHDMLQDLPARDGPQKRQTPRVGLERAVTRTAAARTYGAVATGGCHGSCK
jgi:hypothetical protein